MRELRAKTRYLPHLIAEPGMNMPDGTLKCDFCSSLAVRWEYPCESFQTPDGSVSQGDWAACDECHLLIEAGSRSALVNRSIGTLGTRPGWSHGPVTREQRRAARPWTKKMHDSFFAHRTGKPRPVNQVITVPSVLEPIDSRHRNI